MRANEIEAEIRKRIADHPDCVNVSGVGVHATAAKNPLWSLGTILYRGAPPDAPPPRINEVVSELQREIDLSDK